MSVPKNSPPGDVLHIRPDWAERAAEIDAMLEADSLAVEVCPDVYRGLARVCAEAQSQSQGSSAVRAVVVCVDDLGPAELEFFSIVSRVRRAIPVFVYGQERYNFRVAKAIELGAKGRVTTDAIRSIAAALEPSTPEPLLADDRSAGIPAQASARESADLEAAPVPPVETTAEPVEPEPEPQPEAPPIESDIEEVEPIRDRSSGRRARVPWQRYADRPTRTGPQRTPPSQPTPEAEQLEPSLDASLESPPSPSSAPLLTKAELQALLGDDISAIAPDERREYGPEDVFDEEGTT